MASRRVQQSVFPRPPDNGATLWYPLNDGPLVAVARNVGELYPYSAPPAPPDNTATLTPDNPANVTWNEGFPGLPWAVPCLRVTNQAVQLAGLSGVDPFGTKTEFSLSLWFRGDWGGAPPTADTFLVARFGADYQFTLVWDAGAGSSLKGVLKTTGYNVCNTIGITRAACDGVTNFFVLTYDGSTVTFWKNGVQVGTPAGTNAGVTSDSNPLKIGRNGGGAITALGYYADLRVSDKALSPAEIEAQWLAGKP